MKTSPARPAVSFDDEPLICVDAANNVTGYLDKARCHDGDGLLHRAFSVFVFNRHNQVLLQQRSQHKRLWPGFWANTCCSHPRRGEEVTAAAHRRLDEEMALKTPLTHTHDFTYHARFGDVGSEFEYCSVYVGRSDVAPQVHPEEVAAVAWLTPEALDEKLRDAAAPYSPWLRLEWAALRQQHWATVEGL